MPAALTYPGVYVEEISSGVRTITGVATSITAFIELGREASTRRVIIITTHHAADLAVLGPTIHEMKS